MKALTKLVLTASMLASILPAKADWVNGYTRSNGTSVNSYYRTPANSTPYDNLSYRGYPSQQPGYVSPSYGGFNSSYSMPRTMPSYGNYVNGIQTMPNYNRR